MEKKYVIYRNHYQFSGWGASQATRKVLTEGGQTAVPLKFDTLPDAEKYLEENIKFDDHGYYTIELTYHRPNQWEKNITPTK